MSRGRRGGRDPAGVHEVPAVTLVFFLLTLVSLPVWVVDWGLRGVDVGGSWFWLPGAVCVVGAVGALISRRSAVRYRLLGAGILLACGPVLTFVAFVLVFSLGTLLLGP